MSGWLRFALNKPNQYLGWLSHSHDILITWLMSWIHQRWSKVHDSPVINRKYLQLYHGCFMDIQIFTSNFPWTNRFPMDFPISNQHFPWIFHGFPRKKKHHHRAAQDLFGGRVIPSHEPHVHLTPHRRNDEIRQGQVWRSTWIPAGTGQI